MCQKKYLHINLNLLPVKVTYFLLLAAIAVLLPYLPVYFRELGLTPVESAIILSVTTACTALVRAAVGLIADKLRRHRMIIFVCCLLSGIFHFSILFVQPVTTYVLSGTVEHKICCHNSVLTLCNNSFGRPVNITSTKPSPVLLENSSIAFDSELQEFLQNRQCNLSCCSPEVEPLGTTVAKTQVLCETAMNLTTYISDKNCSRDPRNCEPLLFSPNLTEEICLRADNDDCFIVCENSSMSHDHVDNLVPKFDDTFIILFILFFFGQSAFSPLFNLLDSLVYVYLGDKHSEFGKQRLWGTIAFGIFALSSGFIMDALKHHTNRNFYLYAFIMFLILIILTGLSVYFYKATPTVASDGIRKKIRLLLCNFYLIIAYMSMLVAGMYAGVLEGFLFWFLKELGAEQSLFGVAFVVSCIFETIVLFFSGKIIAKLGFSACLYIVFSVFSIRFLANSFIENPWFVLATEATQGICFGLLYPTVTSWASTLTPPGMHGTVQGVLGAMYMSMGRAVGAALAGVFFQLYGPRTMFRIFSVSAFVFFIILVVMLEIAKWRERKSGGKAGIKVEEANNLAPAAEEMDTAPDNNRIPRDETVEELLDAPTRDQLRNDDVPNGPNKQLVS